MNVKKFICLALLFIFLLEPDSVTGGGKTELALPPTSIPGSKSNSHTTEREFGPDIIGQSFRTTLTLVTTTTSTTTTTLPPDYDY